MSKHIPEFTNKMEVLFTDIITSLCQLPLEQRGYLFGYDGEEDMEAIIDMACYITMEYIKYSFDYADPEYSLRHFIKELNGSDDERMLQQRTLEYVLRYKKRELEMHGIELPPDHKFADLSMDSIKEKLIGYKLTEMNFFEQQNVHDLEVVKAIVQKSIESSKKKSNQRFIEMFIQYDSFIEDIKEKALKSDKDMVFYSIAFFTFEWRYPVETFYYVARLMEENNITEINQSDLILLCGDVCIESRFGGNRRTHSRMVKERFCYLDYLLSNNVSTHNKDVLRDLIKEYLVLGVNYKELYEREDGRKYKDWFREESNISDWASFLKWYDIFSIWEKKEWTPKRIQNMRKLFEMTTMDSI